MKGNKKILVIAVLLLLIAASYSTYAIYKTSVGTNTTVTAARWDVEFQDNASQAISTTNITFNTTECSSNHVKPGLIAPGATCTKKIKLVATNTEVDVTYTATPGTPKIGTNNVPDAANDFTVTLTPANGTISHSASEREVELTLTVAWGGDESDTLDPADTALQGSTITIPVTLVAKQVVGS